MTTTTITITVTVTTNATSSTGGRRESCWLSYLSTATLAKPVPDLGQFGMDLFKGCCGVVRAMPERNLVCLLALKWLTYSLAHSSLDDVPACYVI